jgi:triosephosphate isomerase
MVLCRLRVNGLTETPVIVLNLKTYREALGEGAERLARIAAEVREAEGVNIMVAVPQTDIYRVSSSVRIPVLAQHVDPREPGSWTGHVPPEAVKASGAVGSLVNHSERRLTLADIGASIARLRALGLLSILCTDTPETSAAGAALEPDMLAVEPPELIGTGIPVSKARPEVVTKTVELVRRISERVVILCGAGISAPEDVARAVELGTGGVLLASAYVKAKDPKSLLIDMAKAALSASRR